MDPTNNDIPTPVNPVITPSGNKPEVFAAPEMDGVNLSGAGAMPQVEIPEMPVFNTNNVETVASGVQPEASQPVFEQITGADNVNLGQMSNLNLNATDPITRPEPVKAPDPVEMELNAPFKAADPVPGSIGSAISVPTEDQMETASTVQAPMENIMQNVSQNTAQGAKPKKAKTNKTTLIALCILAGMTIVALVAVLVWYLNQP